MATYKMKKTQRGVRTGEVHSVLFHEGSTYEIDDNLAGEFGKLEAIEESSEDPIEALPEDGRDDLHENWLDTDPAVLRHGELTAGEVVAKDESPYSEGMQPADQEPGQGRRRGARRCRRLMMNPMPTKSPRARPMAKRAKSKKSADKAK